MDKDSLILTLVMLLAYVPFVKANSHEDGEHNHTSLEDEMSAMNKAWCSIRRQIKDSSKNESTLAEVAKVNNAAQEKTKLTPIRSGDFSGDEKKKFMERYQNAMKRTTGLISQLEAALESGDKTETE
tara:strand:- start:1130 stop:1510 length:381 start_codon:yes stop_codon:yes gene_type:complete